MKSALLLDPGATNNARTEIGKRLNVTMRVAEEFHKALKSVSESGGAAAGGFSKWLLEKGPGKGKPRIAFKIKFKPRGGFKQSASNFVTDYHRIALDFVRPGVRFGVKSIGSILAKTLLSFGVQVTKKENDAGKANGGKNGDRPLDGIRQEVEGRSLDKETKSQILEIISILEAKEKIGADLRKLAGFRRDKNTSEEEVERRLNEIDARAREAAPKVSKVDYASFAERVKQFASPAWPLSGEEAVELSGKLGESEYDGLKVFVEAYLEVERKNSIRGSLEYSLYERFLELLKALELLAETTGQSAQNAQQDAVDEGKVGLGGKLARLQEIVNGIESKTRHLRTALVEDVQEGEFAFLKPVYEFQLLCEAATLRSELLACIKELSDAICSERSHESCAYIFHPMSEMFMEFITTSESESRLWAGFREVFARELSAEQSGRIGAYAAHLERIQPESEPAEKKRLEEAIVEKSERKEREKKLLEAICELEDVSRVEGEIVRRAYFEVKSHVRYKLGDWLYLSRSYLTPEKFAEVMLRQMHEMKKTGDKSEVFGTPFTDREPYVKEKYAQLIIHNKRLYELSGRIKTGKNRTIADSLDEAADSIAFMPANIFDAMYDAADAESLVQRGGREETIVFEYEERVKDGKRVILLWREGAEGEPIEVELAPGKFAEYLEKEKEKGLPEQIVGERFWKGADRGYMQLADYALAHLEEMFDTEKEIRDYSSDLFKVACSRQRDLNGIITEFGENPPKYLGDNELEGNLRRKFGDEKFEALRQREKDYLQGERLMAMLDEIHVGQKEIIAKELNSLVFE